MYVCVQVQTLLQEVQQLREELRSRDRTIAQLTLKLVCVPPCFCSYANVLTQSCLHVVLREVIIKTFIYKNNNNDDDDVWNCTNVLLVIEWNPAADVQKQMLNINIGACVRVHRLFPWRPPGVVARRRQERWISTHRRLWRRERTWPRRRRGEISLWGRTQTQQ